MTHPDFNPPGKQPPKLTARRSTITGLFFASLTPCIEPSEAEVDEALRVLGMSRGACVCAYCGDKKSEWDHFRAVVKDRKPTGYITELANLVPACGKCNQSKGNKEWRTWMRSSAKHSPASRGIADLEQRIDRLDAFEKWSRPVKINYEQLAGAEKWSQHLANLNGVLSSLEQAEKLTESIRRLAEEFATFQQNRT